jgi:hypothetical protein
MQLAAMLPSEARGALEETWMQMYAQVPLSKIRNRKVSFHGSVFVNPDLVE